MTDNKQVSAPSTDEATTNSSSLGASVSETTADHADPRDGVVDSAAVDGSAGDTAAPASSRGVTVAVEAFGSGVLLHAGLSVPLDKTVADLRQLVLSARGSANARMVRLFIGHGGTELDSDALTLADSPLADDCDQPLVVLAVPWHDTDVVTVNGWLGEDAAGALADKNGRIKKLELQERSLTGFIPTEIGLLTKLTILKLSYNALTGRIPTEIGELIGLKRLWLNANQLTGSIPTEICGLTALREVRLFKNRLTGRVPTEIGQLTALTALYVDSNQLTGPIPTELGQLTALKRLFLHHNNFTDPAEFASFMQSKSPKCKVDWE
mmetsp:Transcript_16601/g.24340  ORF Transcript_16601/g.24340 Transcript_16601/m.24340 type:complete len:324 (+) Transcript_16601:72-1043(+)|eukprot:CAMPEP_0195521198 /NCGR_PEP_ID=MMETSP0794_2-20130614/18204_1 /TAXON_ID=515487 /ORGANISM="Stephanopyxis turris, Strain CCMP 815" /LENGTH=323 /DNA_ID=CAMNT_0040650705 /DNA_START=66 /DNA_END=1037 /DNA_ORIENTATION=-